MNKSETFLCDYITLHTTESSKIYGLGTIHKAQGTRHMVLKAQRTDHNHNTQGI